MKICRGLRDWEPWVLRCARDSKSFRCAIKLRNKIYSQFNQTPVSAQNSKTLSAVTQANCSAKFTKPPRVRGLKRMLIRRGGGFDFKPGFHMSGKSQTIGDFTFCGPSQIYRIIATSQTQILPINLAGNGKCAKNWNLRDRGTEAQQFRGLVMSEIHRRRPRRYEFEFSFVGNDHRPSQKSGTRRENRTDPN